MSTSHQRTTTRRARGAGHVGRSDHRNRRLAGPKDGNARSATRATAPRPTIVPDVLIDSNGKVVAAGVPAGVGNGTCTGVNLAMAGPADRSLRRVQQPRPRRGEIGGRPAQQGQPALPGQPQGMLWRTTRTQVTLFGPSASRQRKGPHRLLTTVDGHRALVKLRTGWSGAAPHILGQGHCPCAGPTRSRPRRPGVGCRLMSGYQGPGHPTSAAGRRLPHCWVGDCWVGRLPVGGTGRCCKVLTPGYGSDREAVLGNCRVVLEVIGGSSGSHHSIQASFVPS